MTLSRLILTMFVASSILSCSKKNETAPLAACFEVDMEKSGEVFHLFTFTNCSENADRYEWDFGDGISSSIASPSHQYSGFGDFKVRLTAYNDTESKTFEMTLVQGYYKVKELSITNVKLGDFKSYGENCDDVGHRLGVIAEDLSMSQQRTICGINYTADADPNCNDISTDYIVPVNTNLIINSKISCWDGILGGNVENHTVDYTEDKSINLHESLIYEGLKFTNADLGYELTIKAEFEIITEEFW